MALHQASHKHGIQLYKKDYTSNKTLEQRVYLFEKLAVVRDHFDCLCVREPETGSELN